jgi:CheY-like chemotaxis protein
MIEIGFSGPFGEGEGPDFDSGALGMAITRGLLQSYGGELRFATVRPGRYRYDIELPSVGTGGNEDGVGVGTMGALRGTLTALLVEPELAVQRRLLGLFGEGNHRLVPVAGVEEAVDLCEKMRFDVLFCSVRPEGGTWAELFQRTHHRVPYFVLLEEEEETEAAELLEGTTATRLRKPLEEAEVKALMERISERS